MSQILQKQHQRGKTILVVEDDTSIGEMVVLLLTLEAPYHVVLATSAAQALALINKRPPDLMILDYHLPDITGLELYHHLQANKVFCTIPALFLSANPPVEVLEQRQLRYLSKPFDVEVLLSTVTELVEAA